VNLDEVEFPAFEAMFNNLDAHKVISAEFRDFGGHSWPSNHVILPMHLCRTIGEANLREDPFATITLYPFWKYGFAFGTGESLSIGPCIGTPREAWRIKAGNACDPHKKAVVADEMGMGFCAWAMEEFFNCETWADASALIANGFIAASGGRAPDFVCTFKDGSLGIFEAKGTTGNVSNLTAALADGKLQTSAITAQASIKHRIVVGIALKGGTSPATVVILDPDGPSTPLGDPPSTPLGDPHSTPDGERPSNGDGNNNGRPLSGADTPEPIETNLTADMVRRAARAMRQPTVGVVRERPAGDRAGRGTLRPSATSLDKGGETAPLDTQELAETVFRGPKSATTAPREITLTNEFKQDKGHGWLEKKCKSVY